MTTDFDVRNDVNGHADADADAGLNDTGKLIRPYLITGGRTESDAELTLETQIQTNTKGRRLLDTYRWEAAQILQLADEPMALVEISAHTELPIGVTRVIVSDLIADGVMAAHRSVRPVAPSNDTGLLEAVLNGIRSI